MDVIQTLISDMINTYGDGICSIDQRIFLEEVGAICGDTMLHACDVLWRDLDDQIQTGTYKHSDDNHVSMVDCPKNASGGQPYRYLEFRHNGIAYLAAMVMERQRIRTSTKSVSREDRLYGDLILKGDDPDVIITTKIDRLLVFMLGDAGASEQKIKRIKAAILSNGAEEFVHHKWCQAVFDFEIGRGLKHKTWYPGCSEIYNDSYGNIEGFGYCLKASLQQVDKIASIESIISETMNVVDKHYKLNDRRHKVFIVPTRLAILACMADRFIPGDTVKEISDRLDKDNILMAAPQLASNVLALATNINSGKLPAGFFVDDTFVVNDGCSCNLAKVIRHSAEETIVLAGTPHCKAKLTVTPNSISIKEWRRHGRGRIDVTVSRGENPVILSGMAPHNFDVHTSSDKAISIIQFSVKKMAYYTKAPQITD
jgi:hypothetical protein